MWNVEKRGSREGVRCGCGWVGFGCVVADAVALKG